MLALGRLMNSAQLPMISMSSLKAKLMRYPSQSVSHLWSLSLYLILSTTCGIVTIAIGDRKARVARNPVNTAPVYREQVNPTEFSMASLVDILISSASLQPVSLVTAVVLSGQLSSYNHTIGKYHKICSFDFIINTNGPPSYIYINTQKFKRFAQGHCFRKFEVFTTPNFAREHPRPEHKATHYELCKTHRTNLRRFPTYKTS